MDVILLLHESCSQHHPCFNLVEDIEIVLSRINQVSWNRVFREANLVADIMSEHTFVRNWDKINLIMINIKMNFNVK